MFLMPVMISRAVMLHILINNVFKIVEVNQSISVQIIISENQLKQIFIRLRNYSPQLLENKQEGCFRLLDIRVHARISIDQPERLLTYIM